MQQQRPEDQGVNVGDHHGRHRRDGERREGRLGERHHVGSYRQGEQQYDVDVVRSHAYHDDLRYEQDDWQVFYQAYILHAVSLSTFHHVKAERKRVSLHSE